MASHKKKTKRTSRASGTSFARLTQLALALPGTEQGSCYGTPAFRTRKKLLARMWEDGETLVLRASFDQREDLLARAPQTFFLTDHYRAHPWVLVRLPAIAPAALAELLEAAWRDAASKKQLAQLDEHRRCSGRLAR